jgi:hypothetical protein
MASNFKSLAAVKPDAWVQYFRNNVGRTTTWSQSPRLVVIKKERGGRPAADSTGSAREELPLNVVSPVEKYTSMAKAEMKRVDSARLTPKHSVPRKRSSSQHRQVKNRKHEKEKKKVTEKKKKKGAQSTIEGKKKKKDIFSE